MLIPSARADGQPSSSSRGWAPAQWMEWQRQATTFDAIAAYGWSFNFLIRDQGSESIEGMVVTKDYFRVVGLQPILGRTFLDSEIGPTAPPTIIIGYDLWRRTFNGNPNIVGQTVRMSRRDTPPTIIGVMPPNVRFLPSPGASKEPNYDVNAPVDFWMPVAPNPKRLTEPGWNVVGRLKDGVQSRDAQAELTILVDARSARAIASSTASRPVVRSLTAEMNQDGRRVLLPLLGAAALVLLIACGNTAALLLVRGLQRQQEYAVRIAVGAARKTLFRQVTIESLLLALLGGTLGVGLAIVIVRVLRAVGAHAIPRMDAVTVGWPVTAAGLVLAVAAAILAGLIPAVRAARLDPNDVLKSAGPRTSGGTRRSPDAARVDDRADGVDARAAGGCGPADAHDAQRMERARRLRDRSRAHDDRDGRAGQLARLPSAGARARVARPRRAKRRIRVGRPADRHQLAWPDRGRRPSGGDSRPTR